MTKPVFFLALVLPLVLAGCVERDRAAGPTAPAATSQGGSAQRGRGEGELESPARSPSTMGGANTFDRPLDRSPANDLDDGDRDRAGSNEPFVDDREVDGYSGSGVGLPGEPADPRDAERIDDSEIDMMPVDALDAGVTP